MTTNRKKLTEGNVLALPTRKRPYRVWDSGTGATRGLHILVQPTGTKTYRVQYTFNSGQRAARMLGRVGVITLKEAREKARATQRSADDGHDPKRIDPKRSERFGDLINTWTQQEQIGRKRAVSADDSKTFVLSSCGAWVDRPIATIRYHEIETLLNDKRDVAPYAANRLHGHLACFFRWCVRSQRLEVSPMREMLKPWNGDKARDLPWFKGEQADKLIASLWNLADKIGGDQGRFIKLAIITGKRRTIVQLMQWSEIADDWFWTPPAGSSTKRNHPIPLPKLAQRILAPRQRQGRIIQRFNEKGLVTQVRKSTGVDSFIWHGLRHVMETKLAELKVPPHVRDLVLDHASIRGAGKSYDHSDYRDEKLDALERWCAHIERLVQPAENVAMLR